MKSKTSKYGTRRHDDNFFLFHLMEGKNYKEISELVPCHINSVRYRFKKLKKFYGAKTDCQLIAELYHRGVLKPGQKTLQKGDARTWK